MVGDSTRRPRETDEPQRDRGQVILIGAIALAFIILGIVVVFNGVLYTETISSSATSQSAADAAVTQHELEKGIAGIVHWDNFNSTEYDYDSRDYSDLFQNVTQQSGAVITSATISPGEENGMRSQGDITDLNGENVSGTSDEIQVGHFFLEIEDFNGEDVNVTTSTPDNDIKIDGDDYSAPVRIDLVSGTENGTHSEDLSLFDPAESYDEVTVDANQIEGSYELVTKGDDSLSENTGQEAYWSVDATVVYESNDIAFEQEYDIPVYGGEP